MQWRAVGASEVSGAFPDKKDKKGSILVKNLKLKLIFCFVFVQLSIDYKNYLRFRKNNQRRKFKKQIIIFKVGNILTRALEHS